MRNGLIAALIALSTPALAEDCHYVSGFDLGSVRFISDERAELNGVPCGVNTGDESGNELACEDGETLQFSLHSSTFGGSDQDLLVMLDHIWYRVCAPTEPSTQF